MSFPLVQISVTLNDSRSQIFVPMDLNDLERRNGPDFASFHRIRVRCRRRTIVRLTAV